MSAKKMFRTILGKMGVEAPKGDEKALKKAFETALEAGKAPEQLDKPQVEFLKGLGYEIEIEEEPKKGKGKKKAKAPAEDDEDEAPKEPKKAKGVVKAWFQKYWAENETSTRKRLMNKYIAKFGEATKGTCQLYIYEACKSDKKFGFTLVKGTDDKGRKTLTLKKGGKKPKLGAPTPPDKPGKAKAKPLKIGKKGKGKASEEEE